MAIFDQPLPLIGYIVSNEVDNNPGSIFGSNNIPAKCYTVAGWRLDQTKGDHGTVRWSLNCQLMGHASTG